MLDAITTAAVCILSLGVLLVVFGLMGRSPLRLCQQLIRVKWFWISIAGGILFAVAIFLIDYLMLGYFEHWPRLVAAVLAPPYLVSFVILIHLAATSITEHAGSE